MLHVDLDGRTHIGRRASRISDVGRLMLVRSAMARRHARSTRSRASREAAKPGGGRLRRALDGRTMPVQMPGRRASAVRAGGRARGGTGPQRVIAPMPGKVVRVLVKPGDEVKARQGLVVVEAMKMENELRAARDGRVARRRRRRRASRSTPAPCCWSWSSAIER